MKLLKSESKENIKTIDINDELIYAGPLMSIINSLKDTSISNFSLQLVDAKLTDIESYQDSYEDNKMNLSYRNDVYRKDNKHIITCKSEFIFIGKNTHKYIVNITVKCSGNYLLPEYDSYMHKYCYTYIVGMLKLDSRLQKLYAEDICIPDTLDCFDEEDVTRYDGYKVVYHADSESIDGITIPDPKEKMDFAEQTGVKIS